VSENGRTEHERAAEIIGLSPPDKPDPRWQVRVRNLTKRFGTNLVLENLDLDIERHKVNVILGASGAGKSVLIKHFMCLLRPDSGHIWVDGTDVFGLDARELSVFRRKFGLVFQFAALFDSLTVEENCAFPLKEHTKKSKEEIRGIVKEKLAALGLDGTQRKYPGELSGGMRKRVGLARAIVMDPQFILYDEPTTGLDPIMADVIDQLVRSLQRRLGVTTVVVTHDMTSAFKVADRVAMLHEGRIVYSGTVEETRNTRDPLVRQFIEGSSEGPLAT